MVTVLHVSERRACRAIGQLRSSYRYVSQPDPSQERLRERIIALAKEYGRYGYGEPRAPASACGRHIAITSGPMTAWPIGLKMDGRFGS